ncbi:MAG: Hsp20/alpha crystallin family protein [Acidobacteria bacterium]|nr:Hsp20/alpha crystallin family protein [Acidobacteriota bacterium]
MAIIKWDPTRDIVALRDRMNRLFEDMSGPKSEEKNIMAGAWAPSVDIYENENEVVLAAEIPGVDEKDVEIKVEDNTLTLRGERRFEKETKEENYHRIERSYGSFFRSFALPSYIDQDHIEAEHENGVLKIRMPKRAEIKSRKVKILKSLPARAEKSKK